MFLQICDVTIAPILGALSVLKGIQEEINYKVTVWVSVEDKMFSIHFLYFSNSFCLSPLPFRIFFNDF